MNQCIPHWLDQQARLSPNQIAMEQADGSIVTFQALAVQCRSIAKKLTHIGITNGTHVGILSSNKIEMIQVIHALSYIGAVGVLLNRRLSAGELQYQLEDSHADILLFDDALENIATQLNLPHKRSFINIVEVQEQDVELKTELSLQDPFTIIYTSGTTGFPKGVIHTYGNHWWSAIGSVLNLGLSQQDKWLAVLPFFHVGGLSIFIRSTIYGMPVYVLEHFDEVKVQHAIMERGVTVMSVVTVMLQRLVKQLGNKTYPNSFRCMLLGGGPAPMSLLEASKEKQIPVFQSYGMTETSSQIATLGPNDALEKLGSAGKPLMPAQLKIKQPQADGIGEIIVKGPMVTTGYYNRPKENETTFQQGWLATGDLGYLDEDGYLYVVDRRTDLIISGGENIYPTEIEGVLAGMKGIAEVGVIGKPDATWGKVPIACIVLDKHVPAPSQAAMKDYLSERLAAYKIPKAFYFVDKLPRNASNKLVRHQLQQFIL